MASTFGCIPRDVLAMCATIGASLSSATTR
jgi:hypothetical protein